MLLYKEERNIKKEKRENREEGSEVARLRDATPPASTSSFSGCSPALVLLRACGVRPFSLARKMVS
jgi:hypothetical protein